MSQLDDIYDIKGNQSYLEVLEVVQKEMSEIVTRNKLDVKELSNEEVFRYKKHIENCIREHHLKCSETTKISDLVERLYNTMTQYDVLTEYLKPEVYNELGIEEIYGRWNCIYLKTKKGKIRLKEKFPSAQIADNIFSRITQHFNSNSNLNEGTPIVLGEFKPNIRATFITYPITSFALGAEFVIRIVHGSKMTRDLLLETETISKEGLEFLEMCIAHKIGIIIAGGTGSGKTGTMTYLLSKVTKDDTYRVGTNEIECREFDLIRYNEHGECINDVYHWVTRSSDDPKYNITANKLVETNLRATPDIIAIGEMRNSEALMACEMAITGHGVITSIHAKNAANTPMRMVSLMRKAEEAAGMDNTYLLELARQAFPIIVYQKKGLDNSRKIYQIAEFVEVQNGKPVVKNIFEFVVQDTQEDSKLTIGEFRKVGRISDELRMQLRWNFVPNSEIDKY